MADPFSIISLIGTVGMLTSNVYKALSNIQDAPDGIKTWMKELDELRIILPLIHDYASKAAATTVTPRDAMYQPVLEITLQACEKELSILLETAEKHNQKLDVSAFTKLPGRVSWAFRAGNIEKAAKRLESMKLTLGLTLSACARLDDIVLHDGLSHIRETLVTRESEYGQLKFELGRLSLMVEQFISETLTESRRYGAESSSSLNHLSKDLFDSNKSCLDKPETAIDQTATESSVRLDEGPSVIQDERPHTSTKSHEALRSVTTTFIKSYATKTRVINIDQDRLLAALMPSAEVHRRKKERWNNDKIVKYCKDVLQKRPLKPPTPGFALTLCSQFLLVMTGIPRSMAPALAYLLEDKYQAELKGLSNSEELLKLRRTLSDKCGKAMELCNMELDLGPTTNVSAAVERVFEAFIEYLEIDAVITDFWIFALQKPSKRSLSRLQMHIYRGGLDHEWERVKECDRRLEAACAELRTEAEYAHRDAMRQTAMTVKEIEFRQQMILNAVEDQKTILAAMQEEKMLMTIVQDQQRILQTLQQIQIRLPVHSSATGSTAADGIQYSN